MVVAIAVFGGGLTRWLSSVQIRHSSIIDIALEPGFVLCTSIYVVLKETPSPRLLIVMALAFPRVFRLGARMKTS